MGDARGRRKARRFFLIKGRRSISRRVPRPHPPSKAEARLFPLDAATRALDSAGRSLTPPASAHPPLIGGMIATSSRSRSSTRAVAYS